MVDAHYKYQNDWNKNQDAGANTVTCQAFSVENLAPKSEIIKNIHVQLFIWLTWFYFLVRAICAYNRFTDRLPILFQKM